MPTDNTQLSAAVGMGDQVRDLADAGNVKWPVAVACYAVTISAGANVLQIVDATHGLPVAVVGTVPVSAVSMPLPAGAATAARQDTGNTSLASIDGKAPALGQALAANSVPVVLTAAQISTLTPLTSITISAALPAGTNKLGGITIADGDAATLGTTTDAAATTDTGTFSLLALTKRLLSRLTTLMAQLPTALTSGGNLKVSLQETNINQGVSGTVTANAGSGTFINQQSNVTTDYDTGAGVQTLTLWGLALPANGGAVAGGTSSNPVRTDPTGTTIQPVSGTISISGTPNVAVTSLPGTSFAGQTAVTVDYDSGAGTQNLPMVGLALPGSGGAVAGGTSANPFNVTFSSTPTVNIGTSTLAVESGGNLTAIAAVEGTTADALPAAGAAGTISAKLRRVTQALEDLKTTIALTTSSAVIGHVIVDSGTITTVSAVTAITNALPAGTNTIGGVYQVPQTSGGCSLYSVISSGAGNQDAAAVKGSIAQLYGYSLFNTTASARYVKLYNLASGATSASTPVMRIYLPPTGGANMPVGDSGIAFGTGICIRITTGAADNDAGACSANDVLANIIYK